MDPAARLAFRALLRQEGPEGRHRPTTQPLPSRRWGGGASSVLCVHFTVRPRAQVDVFVAWHVSGLALGESEGLEGGAGDQLGREGRR